MKKYLIIVEKTETGFSAFSPDVPGCGSTGKTKEEVGRKIQEAIELHLEGLREEGYEMPESRAVTPRTSMLRLNDASGFGQSVSAGKPVPFRF